MKIHSSKGNATSSTHQQINAKHEQSSNNLETQKQENKKKVLDQHAAAAEKRSSFFQKKQKSGLCLPAAEYALGVHVKL